MCKDGEEPDHTPPRSLIDAEEYRNLVVSPRSGHYTPAGDQNSRLSRSHVEAEHVDDADSIVQQGERSENGDPPVCCSTMLQDDVTDLITSLASGNLAQWIPRAPSMNPMTLDRPSVIEVLFRTTHLCVAGM
jgi:hypothetical protein